MQSTVKDLATVMGCSVGAIRDRMKLPGAPLPVGKTKTGGFVYDHAEAVAWLTFAEQNRWKRPDESDPEAVTDAKKQRLVRANEKYLKLLRLEKLAALRAGLCLG